MSNDLNRCEFIGRVGQDPDIRFTQDGKAIANLSIAVNESYNDKTTGQKVNKATWVPIVVFGKLAEIVQQYVKKGMRLYVAGRFSVRKWQDQSEQDRYTTEVVLDKFNGVMQMLDSAQQNQQQAPQQNYQQQPQQGQQQSAQQQNYQQQRPQQQPVQQQNYQQPQQNQQYNQMQHAQQNEPLDDDIPF